MPTPVVCYLLGTRIRTPGGECKIEELRIGDAVVTVAGEARPIKWIGRQRFKKSSAHWPADFEPIRISALALDGRTPHRDLYLSPEHAVYIDGVLVRARDLVNGYSIRQCAPNGAKLIEYLHVELFTHDVIYAEGATAETYRFSDNRERFENFAEYRRLYPNEVETTAPPCAALVSREPSGFPRGAVGRLLRPLLEAVKAD